MLFSTFLGCNLENHLEMSCYDEAWGSHKTGSPSDFLWKWVGEPNLGDTRLNLVITPLYFELGCNAVSRNLSSNLAHQTSSQPPPSTTVSLTFWTRLSMIGDPSLRFVQDHLQNLIIRINTIIKVAPLRYPCSWDFTPWALRTTSENSSNILGPRDCPWASGCKVPAFEKSWSSRDVFPNTFILCLRIHFPIHPNFSQSAQIFLGPDLPDLKTEM